jgi:diaminopimelate decarboxylase
VNQEKEIMDIQVMEDHLKEIKDVCPQFLLWLEPGRHIVYHAGALLARATEIGEEEGVRLWGQMDQGRI